MSTPDAWGLSFPEVMGLTWLAYKGNGMVGRWNINGGTWNVRSVYEQGSFRAVLVEGRDNVLSFSGTDDGGDWVDNVGQGVAGASGQYIHALRLALQTSANIVVGHSLGGGLAAYCGIYARKRAATINPAPLNINLASLVGMAANQNLVINYVAPGEVLQLLNSVAPNMCLVGRRYSVPSSGGFNPIMRHSISNLDGFVAPTRM